MAIDKQLLVMEKEVQKFSLPPSIENKKQYDEWLRQKSFLSFIKNNIKDGDIILYLSIGNPYNLVYMYGVLVPSDNLSSFDAEDLMNGSCNPTSEWGIRMWPGKWDEAEICPPLDFSMSKAMKDAMQIIFLRKFEGRMENKSYFDVSETVLQPHGLHYFPERSSFCCLDESGDIQNIIKIMCDDSQDNKIVTINKDVLKKHLQITKTTLVLFFESRRTPGSFSHKLTKQTIKQGKEFFSRNSIFGDNESMLRGFQLISSKMIKSKKDDLKNKYEKFISQDWKNKKVKKLSCNPVHLASYFQDSNLPFEMTPVFFQAEVMAKYKNNTEKYKVTDGTITCRNSWVLETYHVNEASQVVTYLIYLSRLPYKEQQYWASFNEKPIGGISKSAFLTDFQGQFDLSYEPLASIKRRLADLGEQNLSWWKIKNRELINELHYPITDSLNEWSSAIDVLNKIVNEGFISSFFKDYLANHRSHEEIKKLGTIKLIREYLSIENNDSVDLVYKPLYNLNLFRTKFSGHTSGSEAKKIRSDLVKNHGSLLMQFKSLVQECDKAMEVLFRLLNN